MKAIFFQTSAAFRRSLEQHQAKADAVWVGISARKQETCLRRLEKLIANSVQGQRLPEFAPRKKSSLKRGAINA
jgi:hypothetical protein